MFISCRLSASVCCLNSLSKQSHKDLIFRFCSFLSLLPFRWHTNHGVQVRAAVMLEPLLPAWHVHPPCTRVLFSLCHLQGQLSHHPNYWAGWITRLSIWIRQNTTLKIQHKADNWAKKIHKSEIPDHLSSFIYLLFVWLVFLIDCGMNREDRYYPPTEVAAYNKQFQTAWETKQVDVFRCCLGPSFTPNALLGR